VGECVYRHFGEEEFDKFGISTGGVSE